MDASSIHIILLNKADITGDDFLVKPFKQAQAGGTVQAVHWVFFFDSMFCQLITLARLHQLDTGQPNIDRHRITKINTDLH